MPLYEYQCDACGHRFEVLQKFSDPRIDTCPKCGSTVHKLMSSPAIQFKGSGFYITDYPKNESGGAPKSSGGAKDKEPSSSSESSSDKGAADKGSDKSSDKSSEKGSDKASDKGKGSDKGSGSETKSDKSSTSEAKPSTPAPVATKKD
jgi:putative FmdB family regulatory protein